MSTTTTPTTSTASVTATLARGNNNNQLDTEDDPDVISSNKTLPDIFEPSFHASKPERMIKNCVQNESQVSRIVKNNDDDYDDDDSANNWPINGNNRRIIDSRHESTIGVVRIPMAETTNARPNTLSVVTQDQDVYTKSLRIQESCI